MSWNAGALGAMMGFGQGLQQLGMMQLNSIQKKQQMDEENQLMMQREAALQRLKPPEVKTVKREDPNNPNGPGLIETKQWMPPDPMSNTPGSWSTIGVDHEKPTYKKDKQTLPGNKEQDILYNENDPTDIHALGSPRDIWNPADADYKKAELANQQARLGIEAGNLAETQRYHNQEHDDRVAGTKQSVVPHTMELGNNVKVQGNIVPGKGFVPLQTPDGDFAVHAPVGAQVPKDADGNPIPTPVDFDTINAKFSPPSNFPGSFTLSPDQREDAKKFKSLSPLSQLSPQPTATMQKVQQAADKASSVPAAAIAKLRQNANNPKALRDFQATFGVDPAQYLQ